MHTTGNNFGSRLREERERIGLNQTQLGAVAGVQRIAQGQYESELRSPTVRYLTSIESTGVDVHYLLFGVRAGTVPVDRRIIEMQAFEFVEKYVKEQAGGQLGAEARYALFDLLRKTGSTTTAHLGPEVSG